MPSDNCMYKANIKLQDLYCQRQTQPLYRIRSKKRKRLSGDIKGIPQIYLSGFFSFFEADLGVQRKVHTYSLRPPP